MVRTLMRCAIIVELIKNHLKTLNSKTPVLSTFYTITYVKMTRI